MNNLVPEARVNKNGVSVIKHVKPAKPTNNSRSKAPSIPAVGKVSGANKPDALKLLTEKLEANKKALFDFGLASLPEAKTPEEMAAAVARIPRLLEGTEDMRRKIATLKTWSSRTLTMLNEAFETPQDLDDFVASAPKLEADVRDLIHFNDSNLRSTYAMHVLRDVRSSVGIEDLSLIDPKSELYRHVTNIINVASAASEGRMQRGITTASSEYQTKQMTPRVAKIVREHPDRLDDIARYLIDRPDMHRVDKDHLSLYLDNPSPSLAEGVL